jgi:hypothetical protein
MRNADSQLLFFSNYSYYYKNMKLHQVKKCDSEKDGPKHQPQYKIKANYENNFKISSSYPKDKPIVFKKSADSITS